MIVRSVAAAAAVSAVCSGKEPRMGTGPTEQGGRTVGRPGVERTGLTAKHQIVTGLRAGVHWLFITLFSALAGRPPPRHKRLLNEPVDRLRPDRRHHDDAGGLSAGAPGRCWTSLNRGPTTCTSPAGQARPGTAKDRGRRSSVLCAARHRHQLNLSR